MTRSKRKRKKAGNPTNIYRVRTGWYLQLQWAPGRVYRELFSNSKYGGRDGALAKAIVNRDWMNKYRAEFVVATRWMAAASEAQDERAYEKAVEMLAAAIGHKLGRGDRAVYDEYFSTERGYVAAK